MSTRIGAGTGSEFSVLPPQNANGNWVKVTQRVPVRIAIDGKSPRELIAGLSADVKVGLQGTRATDMATAAPGRALTGRARRLRPAARSGSSPAAGPPFR